jgi:drug/metabolite transporter (DMT)-like permease
MKTKGIIFIMLGVAGVIFVSTFDIIVGKPRNMIGPKSIIGILACVFLIIIGVISLFKKPKT